MHQHLPSTLLNCSTQVSCLQAVGAISSSFHPVLTRLTAAAAEVDPTSRDHDGIKRLVKQSRACSMQSVVIYARSKCHVTALSAATRAERLYQACIGSITRRSGCMQGAPVKFCHAQAAHCQGAGCLGLHCSTISKNQGPLEEVAGPLKAVLLKEMSAFVPKEPKYALLLVDILHDMRLIHEQRQTLIGLCMASAACLIHTLLQAFHNLVT